MAQRGPQKIWHIRYYDQHGQQRCESTRTADEASAKAILRDREEAAKRKGADISPVPRVFPHGADTKTYQLEGIPADLWRAVQARAAAEGRSVRWVILTLLADWAELSRRAVAIAAPLDAELRAGARRPLAAIRKAAR